MSPLRLPNILYLHAHDVGRYIEPYGYAVKTPHLQRLAEEGVLFRQAFCANPTCSPSRACLLTGQYAHSNGMLGLAHRGFRLHDYDRHLVHLLRQAGYTSALAGMQHEARPPYARVEELGYDRILTEDAGFQPVTEAAERFLAQPPAQPFFLSVGYFAPHRDSQGGFPTLEPPPSPRYVRAPAPLPDTAETRQDFAAYCASVQSTDHRMGRVLTALDRHGLAANTLVIATTDHGIAFPSMKCSLTDHGIGVMLILRGPGGFTGGRVLDQMISQVDVVPTLLELIRRPCPAYVQGRSFLGLLDGTAPGRDQVFAETNFHAAEEPARAVRTNRWKYIRRYGDFPHVVLPNCDEGPSKRLWLRHDWTRQPYEREMLFDLVFDPNEMNNLAADPAHRGVLLEMRDMLHHWMVSTDDPLLHGPLAPPENAVLTSFHEVDPNGGLPTEE